MRWLNLTLTTRERGNAPFLICARHITAIEELKFGGTLIYVSGEVFKVNEDASAVLALMGVDKGNVLTSIRTGSWTNRRDQWIWTKP